MKKNKLKLNTLHIDVESGYGGSSRSLSYLVKFLDKKYIVPEIWIAREGPALARNKENNIICKINKNISYIIPVKRKNILNFFITFPKLLKLFKLAKDIKNKKHDLLHLNHEGLLPLALILRVFGYKKKIIVHKRCIFFDNIYSRLYLKLSNYVDGFIFISEKEKNNFNFLTKNPEVSNRVIYNSYEQVAFNKVKITKKKIFNAIYLGSFNYFKAPDRIIKLAYQTKKKGLPIKYKIFGKENKKKFFFNRSEVDSNFLKKQIKKFGLSNTVFLMGQTNNPERELKNSDILIRPSRRNDNWGRDIIEAMSTGKFIISTGQDDFFLINNVNGVVLKEWNLGSLVRIIKNYMGSVSKFNRITKNAHIFATKKFNGKKNAVLVKNFFFDIYAL